MRNKELAVLLIILAIGAFFRFYSITDIPPGLYPDEATNGNNAVEALETGAFKVFYPENNGREGLFINIQALSLWFFGKSPWALRIPSALFGTLTILGLYLLAKELFSVKNRNTAAIPLLSSFFLATSYWHINFSRVGFRAIMVPFFSTFALYWLFKGLRTGKTSSIILAGIFTGLGFYTYISFRFLPFILLVPLVYYLWRWRQEKIAGVPCITCAIALFVFIVFVVALPIGFYFLQNPQDFLGRSGQVSIFSAEKPLYEFIKSNALTLQMFFWQGDCNPRHNFACQPELFWPVAIFFVFGFFLAIRSLTKEASMSKNDGLASLTLLIWFIFMTLPATLTREGLPHALRSIGLIPPVFILAGWGAETVWNKIKHYLYTARVEIRYQKYWPQIERIKKEAAILTIVLFIFISFQAWRTYFVRFPERVDTYYSFAVDFVHIGEYINTRPNDVRKIVVVSYADIFIRGVQAPAQTIMFITNTFGEEKRRQKRIDYVHATEEISLAAGEKIAIIPMDYQNKNLLREIRKKFPELRQKIPGDFVSFEN